MATPALSSVLSGTSPHRAKQSGVLSLAPPAAVRASCTTCYFWTLLIRQRTLLQLLKLARGGRSGCLSLQFPFSQQLCNFRVHLNKCTACILLQPACFRLYARWPAVVPLMVSNIFKRAVVNLFCHNVIQGVNMDRENKDLNPSPLVLKTSFMNPRSRTDFWLTKCDACAEALQARDPRPQVAAVPAAVCR